MTALEKINESDADALEEMGYCSKEVYVGTNEPFRCGQCGHIGWFLLKAFRVMREIAIAVAHEEFHKMPDWIDGEFEKRMK